MNVVSEIESYSHKSCVICTGRNLYMPTYGLSQFKIIIKSNEIQVSFWSNDSNFYDRLQKKFVKTALKPLYLHFILRRASLLNRSEEKSELLPKLFFTDLMPNSPVDLLPTDPLPYTVFKVKFTVKHIFKIFQLLDPKNFCGLNGISA